MTQATICGGYEDLGRGWKVVCFRRPGHEGSHEGSRVGPTMTWPRKSKEKPQ